MGNGLKSKVSSKPKLKPGMKDITKMTKAEARVAIAKDVIKQIKAKKFVAEKGTYVRIDSMFDDDVREEVLKDASDVRDIVCNPKAGVCTVCAMGSLFLSTARLFDNLPIPKEEAYDGDLLSGLPKPYVEGENSAAPEGYQKSPLKRYFSKLQLSLIEAAFEGWPTKDGQYIELNSIHDEDRLLEIMKNIVSNDGKFVPAYEGDDDFEDDDFDF